MSRIPLTLTPKKQKEYYKIGDIVYIRPDAMNYFDDTVHEMTKFLGEPVEIVDIETAGDRYSSQNLYGLNTDDLLMTVKEIGDDGLNGYWYWSYKCLYNPKLSVPSYEPRKINRTLESLNESINWITNNDELDEISNIPEFRIDDMVRLKSNAIDLQIITFKMMGIPINDNDKKWIENHKNIKLKIYEMAYTNNLNIWLYFLGYEEGGIKKFISTNAVIDVNAPNYKPKNFIRTLESVNIKPKYNFIIFKCENQREFTKIQKDLREEGYIWNSESTIIESNREFPCFVFVQNIKNNNWDKRIFYDSHLNLERNDPMSVLMYRSDAQRNEICPNIFTSHDSQDASKLFNWVNAPSYKSKKFDKTLEKINIPSTLTRENIISNIEKYDGDYIVIKIDGINQQEQLLNFLDTINNNYNKYLFFIHEIFRKNTVINQCYWIIPIKKHCKYPFLNIHNSPYGFVESPNFKKTVEKYKDEDLNIIICTMSKPNKVELIFNQIIGTLIDPISLYSPKKIIR